MCMFGGAPSGGGMQQQPIPLPPPPPPPTPPADPPKQTDPQVKQARIDQQARARGAAGMAANDVTKGALQEEVPTTPKKALGA